MNVRDIEQRLIERGARRREQAMEIVQRERDREAWYLRYWLRNIRYTGYPTPHELATWRKMRTLHRFRWYER